MIEEKSSLKDKLEIFLDGQANSKKFLLEMIMVLIILLAGYFAGYVSGYHEALIDFKLIEATVFMV